MNRLIRRHFGYFVVYKEMNHILDISHIENLYHLRFLDFNDSLYNNYYYTRYPLKKLLRDILPIYQIPNWRKKLRKRAQITIELGGSRIDISERDIPELEIFFARQLKPIVVEALNQSGILKKETVFDCFAASHSDESFEDVYDIALIDLLEHLENIEFEYYFNVGNQKFPALISGNDDKTEIMSSYWRLLYMARKPHKLPKILTDDEVMKFLNGFNTRYISPYKNQLMCRLSLETGMRISEIINLSVEDIDWNTGRTHIKEGKGRQDRIVYINAVLLPELEKLRDRCKIGKTGALFTTRSGKRYDRRNLDRMVKKNANKETVGITKNVHFHMFRHTYATKVLKETGNLRITQKVLGHRNISNTIIYTHLTDEVVENVMSSSLY